ncbi:MAG: phosphoribosyltransferase, partial [Anaerolineales bacterium]
MQDYREFMDEILVDEKTIEKRVTELGAQISYDYQGQTLLVVCLLRGGLTFTADLTRHLSIPHYLDCMSLSSYGVGHYASSGNVRVNLDLMTNIEGLNVLLVEDIVDSGRTLAHVLQMLKTREPKSLKVCVLLDKKYRREVRVEVD